MAHLTHNVAPRYTAGSPAWVDERTALRVAAEERAAYEGYLYGVYGEKAQAEALAVGLTGIVERRREIASGWRCEDVLTGRRFLRLRDLRATKLRAGDRVVRVEAGQYTGRRLDDAPPWSVRTVEVVKHAGHTNVIINANGDDREVLTSNTRLTVERDEKEV